MKVAQGEATRREPAGEPIRTATADGTEPENAGRRENRRTAGEGEEPGWANGKPEESPDGNPEAVR